jgi:hypothetical protein
MKEIKLIALYFYVSERYEKDLKYSVERFSHNSVELEFTDAEALSLYLYVLSEEKRLRIKEIYDFARGYLLSWFPKLPSYQAFDHRLDRLWEVLRSLLAEWLIMFMPQGCSSEVSVTDSLSIITCSTKRDGKVAREITDKGYCATKGLYYYGIKLHVMAWQRPGHMPWIEGLILSEASRSDVTVFKENYEFLTQRVIMGDKGYKDEPFFKKMYELMKTTMLIPIKLQQGKPQRLKYFDQAANDLFSAAVSRVRQPIESLFNWIIEKTDIQRASKVRSTKGLLLHVFGRLAAAFLSVVW